MNVNELLTVREAAERLRCSERTVARYIRDGRLPLVNVSDSRAVFTTRSAVAQLSDEQRRARQ